MLLRNLKFTCSRVSFNVFAGSMFPVLLKETGTGVFLWILEKLNFVLFLLTAVHGETY